jgi:hypothetical protein
LTPLKQEDVVLLHGDNPEELREYYNNPELLMNKKVVILTHVRFWTDIINYFLIYQPKQPVQPFTGDFKGLMQRDDLREYIIFDETPIFLKPFCTIPKAMFGNGIIKTNYQPFENALQSPGCRRYPIDLKELDKMLDLWMQGMALLKKLLPQMPSGHKADNGARLYAMGQYIVGTIHTVIHAKKWFIANQKLQSCPDPAESEKLLDELLAIIDVERENVKSLIPAVELDSRLGWEPSMEYVCDKWHLEWKLRQLDFAVKEIEQYRKIVQL